MVSDGEEAVRLLGNAISTSQVLAAPQLSLIILDLNLPGKSGLEVLAWIRAMPALDRIPVFMLTSSEDMGHVSRAFDLRTDSYIVKLGSLDELQKVVEGILASSDGRVGGRILGSLSNPRSV